MGKKFRVTRFNIATRCIHLDAPANSASILSVMGPGSLVSVGWLSSPEVNIAGLKSISLSCALVNIILPLVVNENRLAHTYSQSPLNL